MKVKIKKSIEGSMPIKLNLGCGLTTPKGWVNIDRSWNAWLAKWPQLRSFLGRIGFLPKALVEIAWSQNIKIHNVCKGLPYLDESVQYIYASHLLEHITRVQAEALLRECYRVLLPDGVIRIVVPDLMFLCKKYLDIVGKPWDKLPPAEKFLEDLNIFDISAGRTRQYFWIKFWKKIHDKNIHKWMYDAQSLKHLLTKEGFSDIRKRAFRESFIDDINKLDSIERFHGSICIEAVKKK